MLNMFHCSWFKLFKLKDLELGKSLIRPSSLFMSDLAKTKKFSNEGYGSVTRVFIVCNEDKAITKEFQRWMINKSGVKEVIEIDGSDHMPMFSKPQQLSDCLSQIIHKYCWLSLLFQCWLCSSAYLSYIWYWGCDKLIFFLFKQVWKFSRH